MIAQAALAPKGVYHLQCGRCGTPYHYHCALLHRIDPFQCLSRTQARTVSVSGPSQGGCGILVLIAVQLEVALAVLCSLHQPTRPPLCSVALDGQAVRCLQYSSYRSFQLLMVHMPQRLL